ncbi:MAG: amidohydrolase family protein [Stellaceae bacterium]
MTEQPHRIDVHAHFAPPEWIAAQGQNLIPAIRNWSINQTIDDMDAAGIERALLSITTPGLWFESNATARRIARHSNDFAATLRADHPGRFGVFTALPLPDIDGALHEIAYGLDQLKADGVGLLTSYGDKWLGDPTFDPVMAELNRRKAVAYVHPTSPDCCRNIVPGVPDAAIEFGTDTTRAIARTIFGGAAARFPDIKMIWSHAGGTMPFLLERFEGMAKMPNYAPKFPNGFAEVARRFHYDTAQVANKLCMTALREIVPVSQIVFGTDYPFRSALDHVEGLHQCGVFDAAELKTIDRDNALRLLRT